MAVLGSLAFGVLDSGVAQLLVKRPKTNLEFNHRGATFRAAPDTPFIVCCFSGSSSHVDAATTGSELLQEGLDMLDGERAVLDVVREVKAPLRPDQVAAEFSALFKQYRVCEVRSDRYGAEWVTEAFRKHEITVKQSELTSSELFIELLPLINSRQVVLLDNDRVTSQLVNLERRVGRTGRDSVGHPPGLHDDLAVVVAGAAHNASTIARRGEVRVGYTPYGGGGRITWLPKEGECTSGIKAGPHQSAAVVGRYFNFATKQWVQM
jgi:hypothetical protein